MFLYAYELFIFLLSICNFFFIFSHFHLFSLSAVFIHLFSPPISQQFIQFLLIKVLSSTCTCMCYVISYLLNLYSFPFCSLLLTLSFTVLRNQICFHFSFSHFLSLSIFFFCSPFVLLSTIYTYELIYAFYAFTTS